MALVEVIMSCADTKTKLKTVWVKDQAISPSKPFLSIHPTRGGNCHHLLLGT